ncbi:TetR/AcrR family transcriptional regulator [Nocardia sp. alder85J]|uniref:TetR/AcrR family transcriptional regulator n=1 Tax=Nocardia sp. alder85J TaxID=2862949 RepID=UPI001CD212BF|nr:TetR/AcrR family transcriptional regulator [Nocardia sp. alder85J]MCX4090914.1 TetR/AcrR family transcriptional regulator [Nocardia sp. alder85J]
MSTDDRTTSELIRTGLRLMIEQPGRLLDGGLRSEDVINAAETSHATFYRKFATKSRFLDAVLRQLVDPPTPAPADLRETVRTALHLVHGDRRRALRALVQDQFDAIFDARLETRRLLATALGPSDTLAGRALTDSYRRGDHLVRQIFETLFEHSGITLRKPLTSKSFCMIVTAVLDGFVIRHRAEPAAVTAELVADALVAVLSGAIDGAQQHGHLDDMLSAIAAPAAPAARLPREPRAALLAAGRDEFTRRGYLLAGIDTIAAAAGVPLDAALRIFPTKRHLVVGALKSAHEALGQGIADDITLGHDALAVVERHLVRLARLVEEQRPFMSALVAVDAPAEPDGSAAPERELDFAALLVPVLEKGRGGGLFAADQPVGEVAAMLTGALLLRCVTGAATTPEQHASFVARVVLDGVRSR